MTTWPGPGVGTGTSSRRSTSAPPVACIRIAFIGGTAPRGVPRHPSPGPRVLRGDLGTREVVRGGPSSPSVLVEECDGLLQVGGVEIGRTERPTPGDRDLDQVRRDPSDRAVAE